MKAALQRKTQKKEVINEPLKVVMQNKLRMENDFFLFWIWTYFELFLCLYYLKFFQSKDVAWIKNKFNFN